MLARSRAVLFVVISLSSVALAKSPAYSKSHIHTVRATVEAVDVDARTVTLKSPDGSTQTYDVGPKVKNLKQVHVGDELIIQYKEALAVYVKPGTPGTPLPPPTETTAGTQAKLGEKPAASVAHGQSISATVEAVDAPGHTVTLKGPKGNVVVLEVKDPKALEGVKVGDQVTAEYTSAMAIAVQAAGPKAPTSTTKPASKK
jgi:Cu/Ag efflux protein CusF